MRFIIDIEEAQPDRVEGRVTREGDQTPLPFCGWLELLSLLEPPSGQTNLASEPPTHPEQQGGSSA